MSRFVARRAIELALTIWIVLTLAFFLMRVVPGGPFSAERALPPEVERNVHATYHLDWPLWRQYLQYVGPLNLDERGLIGERTKVFGGLLAGDFGPSFRYRDYSVNQILAESLPVSVLLGSLALLWAVAIGVAVGIASAMRPSAWFDVPLRAFAALGAALPNFVIAGLLILLFAFTLDALPAAGSSQWKHLILPSLALGLPFAAAIARLARTGLLETLSQDFIRTAHAKGVPRSEIVTRHALKGGLLPVISYLGPASAGVLTGSLVIEKIFAIPGCGTHFVSSALNRDYTLALGVTIVYATLIFVLNTAVDLAYGWLDPRIRVEDA